MLALSRNESQSFTYPVLCQVLHDAREVSLSAHSDSQVLDRVSETRRRLVAGRDASQDIEEEEKSWEKRVRKRPERNLRRDVMETM